MGISAACVFGLAACGSASGGTGGVAATVNGTEISEDKVTSYIEEYRASNSLDTEDAWGEWLAQSGYTPESVREDVINSYVTRELIKTAAGEQGITVDSSEVDGYVDSIKSQLGVTTDEEWQSALETAGMTEEEYRDSIALSLESEELMGQVAPLEDPAEEDVLTYCQMYATYYDGAKRSSHILFDSGDEATAQSVLDQINAGTLDFAQAATEYSKDEGSAANGGNVGWDKLSSFVTEYTDALDGLEEGQVSGLVTSQYGIHIIKCTEVFTAPEEVTSSDQIPSEFVDSIKSMLSEQNQSTAYQTWIEEYQESADVVINEMPENLPYWVDMTKYETADEDAGSDTSSTEEGTTVTNEDGSTTTTYSDGSTVTNNTDGTSKAVNADGSYSETDASGTVRAYDASGNLVSETSAESTEAGTEGTADDASGEGTGSAE